MPDLSPKLNTARLLAPPAAARQGQREDFFFDRRQQALVPRLHNPSGWGSRFLGALAGFDDFRAYGEARGWLPITDPARVLAGLRQNLAPQEAESPTFFRHVEAAVVVHHLPRDAKTGPLTLVERTRRALRDYQQTLDTGGDRTELVQAVATPVAGAGPTDHAQIVARTVARLPAGPAHQTLPAQAAALYQDEARRYCLAHNEAQLATGLPAPVREAVRQAAAFGERLLDAAGLSALVRSGFLAVRARAFAQDMQVTPAQARAVIEHAYAPDRVPAHAEAAPQPEELAAWARLLAQAGDAAWHAGVTDRAHEDLARRFQNQPAQAARAEVLLDALDPILQLREKHIALGCRFPGIDDRLSVGERLRALRHQGVARHVLDLMGVEAQTAHDQRLTASQREAVLEIARERLLAPLQAGLYRDAVHQVTALARVCQALCPPSPRPGEPEPVPTPAGAIRLFDALAKASEVLEAAIAALAPDDEAAARVLREEVAFLCVAPAERDAAVVHAQYQHLTRAITGSTARPIWAALNAPALRTDPHAQALAALLRALVHGAIRFDRDTLTEARVRADRAGSDVPPVDRARWPGPLGAHLRAYFDSRSRAAGVPGPAAPAAGADRKSAPGAMMDGLKMIARALQRGHSPASARRPGTRPEPARSVRPPEAAPAGSARPSLMARLRRPRPH